MLALSVMNALTTFIRPSYPIWQWQSVDTVLSQGVRIALSIIIGIPATIIACRAIVTPYRLP